MGELVLLVVAAAWAAVLIPPLLRSRIENRPNSSVTDFRRQLNKLQGAVPHRAGGPMRGIARPLAQSPLQRPAAGGRPGVQPAQLRRTGSGSHPRRPADQPWRHRYPGPRARGTQPYAWRSDRWTAPPATAASSGARRPPRRVGRRSAPSTPLERVVHARAGCGRNAVPGSHDPRAGDAVPVRPGVPRPVRLRLPPVAGSPARERLVAQRLDASLTVR